MEKQLRIVKYVMLLIGSTFFVIGAVIFYKTRAGVLSGSEQDPDYIFPIVFMGIGLVDVLTIVTWLLISRSKAKKEKWLLENGQTIRARFASIEKNKSISVNGRNPYYIVCSWQDTLTGTAHVFKSKNLWTDPASFIDQAKTITVYVDPAKMKTYLVDTSFLPSTD